MNGLLRAALAGAIGAFAGEKLGPKVAEYLKPESDFAKKSVHYGIAAGSTAAAWYALGMVGLKS